MFWLVAETFGGGAGYLTYTAPDVFLRCRIAFHVMEHHHTEGIGTLLAGTGLLCRFFLIDVAVWILLAHNFLVISLRVFFNFSDSSKQRITDNNNNMYFGMGREQSRI